MNPFHRPGNNKPQTKHYLPVRTFGHHSLNNLLLFFQPSTIEEKLHLIEAYIIVNDWNSAEALLEQLYDDIKSIDIHATYQGANNYYSNDTSNDKVLTHSHSTYNMMDSDDRKDDSGNNILQSKSHLYHSTNDVTNVTNVTGVTNAGNNDDIHDIRTATELIDHYLELAYQLRIILKQNSAIIQQLRVASSHILDNVRIVKQESWMFKPGTKGHELALEFEKSQNDGKITHSSASTSTKPTHDINKKK